MKFLNDIKSSIFQFSFYKEAAKRPLAQAFKFLLVLVAIVTVILSFRLSFEITGWVEKASFWLQSSLPEIVINNGKVESEVQQPFTLEQENQFVFILDTTNTVTQLPAQYPFGVLLTENKVFVRESASEVREYNLSQVGELVINEETIESLKKTAKLFILPFLLTFLFIYFILARLFQVLFFSLVALTVNSAAATKLSYRELFVLGIYASAPCAVLGMVVGIIGRPLPLFSGIYLACYLTYLIVGILQHRTEVEYNT